MEGWKDGKTKAGNSVKNQQRDYGSSAHINQQRRPKKNLNYSFKVSNLRFLQDQKTSKCHSELSTTAT